MAALLELRVSQLLPRKRCIVVELLILLNRVIISWLVGWLSLGGLRIEHEVLVVGLWHVALVHCLGFLVVCSALWQHLGDRPSGEWVCRSASLALAVFLGDRLQMARCVVVVFRWQTCDDAGSLVVGC